MTDVSAHTHEQAGNGKIGPESELEDVLARRQTELDLLRGELQQLRAQLLAGERELARLAGVDSQLSELRQCVTDLEPYREMHKEYLLVFGSRSWRLTAPLRRAAALLKGRQG